MVWLSVIVGLVGTVWLMLVIIGWRIDYVRQRNHRLLD